MRALILLFFLGFTTVILGQKHRANRIHPCNLIVTLFEKDLKCGIVENGTYETIYSCTTDTTKYRSDWLYGKNHPSEGYTIQFNVSPLGDGNYSFDDSSFYLSTNDFQWQDSVGEIFLDTASFQEIESIAARYEVDHYADVNNRIYIDRGLPIKKRTKQFPIKTTFRRLLVTITLPKDLKNLCVYDPYVESTFEYALRKLLTVSILDENNSIVLSVQRKAKMTR